jgi:hypothetical protein
MLKTFNVKLDIKRELENPSFTVSQNDLNTVQLVFNVVQDGSPFDLTGLIPRLSIKKPSGLTVFQDSEVTDVVNGVCQVTLSSQAYAEIGLYTGELNLYKDGTETPSQVAVTGRFTYNAEKSILSDNTVESTNDWQSINTLIGEINGLIAELNANIVSLTEEDILANEEIQSKLAVIENYAGFTDGRSIEYVKGKRIHLKTDEKWVLNEGHLSDLIRLQWITREDGAGSKPALVWCDDNMDDKAAIIAHDKANDVTRLPHKHISIETTMSPTGPNPKELFTRMEFPYDEDVAEIQTHSSNLTVNSGILKVGNSDGANKEMRFVRANSKETSGNYNPTTMKPYYDKVYSARWSVRADSTVEAGGNAGSDFRIVRFDDTGNSLDSPFFIKRSNGNIGIGAQDPQRKLDINDSRIRVRNSFTPASSTATGLKGDIAWNNDYVYVCVADNTWKRTALSTW